MNYAENVHDKPHWGHRLISKQMLWGIGEYMVSFCFIWQKALNSKTKNLPSTAYNASLKKPICPQLPIFLPHHSYMDHAVIYVGPILHGPICQFWPAKRESISDSHESHLIIIIGNSLRQGPTGPSSLAPATQDKSWDQSVQAEMSLCSWKRFFASLDGSVRLEMLLCSWKQFYATFDRTLQLEMLLCS